MGSLPRHVPLRRETAQARTTWLNRIWICPRSLYREEFAFAQLVDTSDIELLDDPT